MAFTSITKPAVGDATKKTAFADAVIDNLNDLNSRLGAGGAAGISNPSFENDEDADADPDGWTVTDAGGTHTLPTSSGAQSHGAAAINFAYPATNGGGGYLETTDFYECAPGEIISIAWKMLGTSATGAKHIIRFYWYQYDKTACTTPSTDAYSDTTNPTAWTQCYTQAKARDAGGADDAKFFKIRIIASDTSATPSGTGNISFDDLRLRLRPDSVFESSATCIDTGTNNSFRTDNVRLLWVEAWGGGGGGAGSSKGGGGGGEYAAGYLWTDGSTSYAISIGAGGSAGNGGNTTFNSTTVVANGGIRATTTAGGAGGTGGTGVITIDGQAGEAHAAGKNDGGSSPRGGCGGAGKNASSGVAGAPGGGGGGDTTTPKDGADGQVRIWFNF